MPSLETFLRGREEEGHLVEAPPTAVSSDELTGHKVPINHVRSAIDPNKERHLRYREASLQERKESDIDAVSSEPTGQPSVPVVVPASNATSASTATATTAPSSRNHTSSIAEKRHAAELLVQTPPVSSIAEGASTARPSHLNNVDKSRLDDTTSQGRFADSERASPWSGKALSNSHIEGGCDIDIKSGAKYDIKSAWQDAQLQDGGEGSRTAGEMMEVDEDPEAIRFLKPRPCH